MNKAYVRKPEGSEVFEFTFQYNNEELKINRQFNFNRKLSETAEVFISRVATNLEKICSKKQKKRKKNEDEAETNPLTEKIHLYQNGTLVNNTVTCEELFSNNDDLRLKIIDEEFIIAINTPFIKSVSLPTSILANFPVYPSKFETMFMEKGLSEFTWFKSEDKNKWVKIGEEFLYTPKNDDINSYLKINCVPKNSESIGLSTEVISKNKIEADPGHCPFENRHKFTQERLKGRK